MISVQAVVLLPLATSIVQAQTPMVPQKDVTPGQMWSIKTMPSTSAKVVIGKVESWGDGTVVHVSVIDAQIPQDLPGAGRVTNIGHLPFEKGALAASLDQLLATGASPAPDFERGYQQWKSANGGIFTISIPEVIRLAFEIANKPNAK
jgi:hypothetical protein